MRALPLLFLAAACAFASGCASRAPAHKMSWRTISRGIISGLDTPQRVVLREEAAYYRFWAEHASGLARPALPPRVDFTREMVVAIALGNRPTGGYFLEVVDLELHGKTLRVLVSERVPRPGILQMQQATQPYQMIALPIVTATVDFKSVREQAGTSRSSDSGTRVRETPPTRTTPSVRKSRPAPQQPLRSPRDATR